MNTNSKHEYKEVKLSVVLDYWLSEYKPTNSEYRVMETSWMVDPFKSEAVFKLVLINNNKKELSEPEQVKDVYITRSINEVAFFYCNKFVLSGKKEDDVIETKWFVDPIKDIVLFQILVAVHPKENPVGEVTT